MHTKDLIKKAGSGAFRKQSLFVFALLTFAGLLVSSCGVMWGGVTPLGTSYFLYVGDGGTANGVYGFSINIGTGALTAVPGSPFPGITPASVVADPLGRFLYVADQSTGIIVYSINSITGVLTQVAGSPFAAGTSPYAVTVDATGRFVYAGESGGLYGYAVNSSTGALNQISGSPFSSGQIRINSDAFGRFVFGSKAGGVYVFTIDPQSGALGNVAGSPFAGGGANCRGVTSDATDSFVYIACGNAGIIGYSMQSSGILNVLASSPFAYGTQYAQQLAVVGQTLYLEGGSGGAPPYGVYGEIINPATGALTAISGSPFAPSTGGFGVAADPTGSFIYAAASGGGVYGQAINSSTGALSPISGSPYAISTIPYNIATVKISQSAGH